MKDLVAAIDQGTTSSRCLVFESTADVAAVAQEEHEQIHPRPGWVEHDAAEIWERTRSCIRGALDALGGRRPAAVGITNQRETLVVWDRRDGRPLAPAVVWQDTRTRELVEELARDGGSDRWRATTGLPLATYFSGPKLAWLLEHTDGLRAAAEGGRALAGTIDSWLVWNLTGGPDGGRHVTDVTNASRTQLLDIARLEWDEGILGALDVPRAMLPEVVPSSSATAFGTTRSDGPFGAELPIAGVLGDQHAALLGQGCLANGDAKNTYGTGCFLLANTGEAPVASEHGLLTTLAWQREGRAPLYAAEGSVAVAGALVQWVRDQLGLIASSSEIEALARGVDDNGGVYFVPAFSGLFAPRWRPDARGVVVGLTAHSDRRHLARAVLEAAAYQTREVLDAMTADSGRAPTTLRVDGGMAANDLLMQFQADVLGVAVHRPKLLETTALGAAAAAALATGLIEDETELARPRPGGTTFEPRMAADAREALFAAWNRAVERSLDWVV